MLYTKHQYDTSDRIASQSWQIGDEAFTESYIYREEDGNIESMSIGDETIQYTYTEEILSGLRHSEQWLQTLFLFLEWNRET